MVVQHFGVDSEGACTAARMHCQCLRACTATRMHCPMQVCLCGGSVSCREARQWYLKQSTSWLMVSALPSVWCSVHTPLYAHVAGTPAATNVQAARL